MNPKKNQINIIKVSDFFFEYKTKRRKLLFILLFIIIYLLFEINQIIPTKKLEPLEMLKKTRNAKICLNKIFMKNITKN